MKKISIGIPRAFHYYRYGVLWKTFFEKIGFKVILSPKTNDKIIELGVENTPSEFCLSYKIYIGHVLALKDKCDYIFIPEICNYGPKASVCHCHSLAYNHLKMIISKNKIMTYQLNHVIHKYQIFGLIKIALKKTKNPIKIIYGYLYAKKKQYNYNLSRQNENKNKISKENKKILIVSPFYILQDAYITKEIISHLENNNFLPIYANYLDYKIAKSFSLYYRYIIKWKYYQELIGAIYYYKYQVDGIIIIGINNCQIGSIMNPKIIKEKYNIPIIELSLSENNSNISINQQLDVFLNIIK